MLRFLVAALLVVECGAAKAQTPGTAGISQDRIAAATRLLAAMHYDELMDQTVSKLIAQAQQMLPGQLEAQTQQQLPDELKQRVAQATADYLRRKFADNRPEMRQSTILIYAHHFTTAELDHLAQLQSDPVMAKMQRELPAIMTEISTFTQAETQRDMPELVAQLKAVIQDYLHTKS
jgi:hypothetical protein